MISRSSNGLVDGAMPRSGKSTGELSVNNYHASSSVPTSLPYQVLETAHTELVSELSKIGVFVICVALDYTR